MAHPFIAFNFRVEIRVPDLQDALICDAAFAECEGLEMTMDAKTIREGGNNTAQILMIGPVSYGAVTLRRGMTSTFDLWDWFDAQQRGTAKQLRSGLRGDAEVVILGEDGAAERVRFLLKKCLLTKLKAPVLNAKDGTIAIEELQLAFESMSLKRPKG